MAAFERLFVECKQEFFMQVKRMVRDRNSFKFTNADAPKRLVISYPVHRLIFQAAFGSKFLNSEREVGSDVFFSLRSSSRFIEIFGIAATIKANSSLDWSLVLPQCYCLNNFEGVERGDIVFPIKEDGDSVLAFVPGGVGDADVSKVSLETILGVDLKELLPIIPERTVDGYTVSVSKGDHHVSIRAGSPIAEGDYLVIRGKLHKIHGISEDDAFFPVEGSRNVINIKGKFVNNVTDQKLRYKHVPSFFGKVVSLANSLLVDHKVLKCYFAPNKNGNKHGMMHLSYYNTIFNQMGYMIHDRAIHLDQLV